MSQLDQIWDQVATQSPEDGKKYIIFKLGIQDLMFLYMSGFVDARKYSFTQWVEAFKPSRRQNGHYWLTKEQWLDKKKFHYTGPVNAPFDPMTMEEKDYTEQEVLKLLKDKILPGTMFSPAYAPTVINNLKAQGRLINGKFRVDRELKKYLLGVMNQYPSPMRILEVGVDKMRKAKKGDAKFAQEQVQKSAFTAGSTAQQIAAARLSSIMGSGRSEPSTTPKPGKEEGGISLKDLQKRRVTPGKI